MDNSVFSVLLKRFDNAEVFSYLIEANSVLSAEDKHDIDYELYLQQITEIVERFEDCTKNKKQKDDNDSVEISMNLFKLVSRNLMLIFAKLSTKVYDFGNKLLNQLNENDMSGKGQIAVVILIDLFDVYPNSLVSLINFSVTQIYKILKKNPTVNSNLVYLLYTILRNATKADVDEKLQSKLMKIVTKNITSGTVTMDLEQDSTSTFLLKKNYMLCLKTLLLLNVSTFYEGLLALSTSSSSAGSKMKPEAIMSQQHTHQVNLLQTYTKYINFGLSSISQEVRIATIELLSTLFINFIPTGKFSALEYLADQYSLPDLNMWDQTLSTNLDAEDLAVENRRINNTFDHDSEAIIRKDTEVLLSQISIIETIISYIQLESFQNPDFLSNNLTAILDMVLAKFSDLNKGGHIQNQKWHNVLNHWSTLIDFLVKESGSSCHEILAEYIYSKFKTTSLVESTLSQQKTKKKDSLFVFKGKQGQKNKKIVLEIKPYHNPYQNYILLHIVDLLLPYGTSYSSIVDNKEDSISDSTDSQTKVEDDEQELSIEKQDYFLRDTLFRLLINDNSYIRNCALKSLLKYAEHNEVEVNNLILRVFHFISQQLKTIESEKGAHSVGTTEDNVCNLPQVKLYSYSLALSALIRQTDFTLLLNATTVKVLSFCTQNLKHNNNNNSTNFLISSSCWIILSSLVTFYNESEYVRLNSSQFLVFWKSLLTSQFISSSLDTSNDANYKQEIVNNLQLRNFSLVCLLNYLNSVELTPESLKQIQFLLTKSYNYLSYLESNIGLVGSVTNFNAQGFNENDFNVNMVNNIHYSNYLFNKKLSFEKLVTSLILNSKKIILQSFTKLATLLKNDINSNMVIFLIKLISDPSVFSRLGDSEKPKASKSKSSVKATDFDDDAILLGEDYNYSFGVTSKFQKDSDSIDELLIKYANNDLKFERNGILYEDSFIQNYSPLLKGLKDKNTEKTFRSWLDYFEKDVNKFVHHSINCDPNIFLVRSYSAKEKFSPNLVTSLVDISIELFQLVFPYLSDKIQFSLLEQIRNSLTAKFSDKLRYQAVQVNVSVAIHGMLKLFSKKKMSLNKDLVEVIADIISKIQCKDEQLVEINSESIGLYTEFLQRQGVNEEINKIIQNIINNSNPYNRGFSILSLSKIYRQSHVSYSEISNVGLQLLRDPNPIVYRFTLKAMSILFESNVDAYTYIPEFLEVIHSNFLSNNFGYDITNNTLVNLKCKYGSVGVLASLVKVFVTSLGPSLLEFPLQDRQKLRNLIISLTHGIGLQTTKDQLQVYGNLLQLFQELIIFDPKLINGEVDFFTSLLNLIVSKNLKIGLVSVSPTSLNRDSLFPYTTSFDLYKAAYECYVELIKIFGSGILKKDTVSMLWISMNIRPCSELKDFIQFWLESSLDMNWFVTLNSLFKFSAKKLISPYIETNYQQKLLPLSQRQKKKQKNNIDFKDEEIESIVAEDAEQFEKIESITWEFKMFIFDLLNHLLNLSTKNPQLLDKLKSRIPELVKMSFLGSTSPITDIKLKGINLLDKVLGLFGHMVDSLYPDVSILEQQQAQIISALIPCFNADSNAAVIVNAINVSSKFINLPRIKFYSKQRLLKTLICLLEEISSGKFLKFVYLENMSEHRRKSIQLSILNCWALLKINSQDSENESEPELAETLQKYSKLLIPLWILMLREMSQLKYNDTAGKEIEIYSNYWINYISVLNIELENNKEEIDGYLSGDAENFFFVLFSQCVESLIKNKNVPEILTTLNRLLKSSDLVDLLFNDEIFGEVVDLFDRLILIDVDSEVQCELIDIISTIFHTYINKHSHALEDGFDKLFELIRMEMLPLFNILPFLKTDYDPTNQTQQYYLKKADSASNLVLLKKTFQYLIGMVEVLPDAVRADMYSCLLFIFSKIYQYQNELLISVAIPHLKQIVIGSTKLDLNLVQTFSNVIRDSYTIDVKKNYTIITAIVLVTSGNIQLDEEESKQLSDALIELLSSNSTVPMAIQCIKSLIQNSSETHSSIVLKYSISHILSILSTKENMQMEPKVAIEILFLFSRTIKDETKSTALYSVLIPLLIRFHDSKELSNEYLHERLLLLINHNPQSFKTVVNTTLSDTQKQLAETLVKTKSSTTSTDDTEQEQQIQLKTFG